MVPRILIVDDEAHLRRVFTRLLQVAHYHILTAASGPEAVALAGSAHPDLILLDLGLGGMNGFEVFQRLRAAPATKRIPVVFITGRVDEQELLQGASTALHAEGFLTKPVSQDRLLAVLERVLEASRPGETIQRGPIRLDPESRLVWLDNRPIENLSREEFDLCCVLARHSSGMTRDAVIACGAVKGSGKAVDMAISRLRARLGPQGRAVIETIPHGYRIGER